MMRLAELRGAADCWSLTGFDTVVNSFSDRAVDHLRIVFSPFAASASANVDHIVVDAVPVAGPIAGGLDLGWRRSSRLVANGGRKSAEHSRVTSHVVCGAASDRRTIAIYEYTP
jgi:hypothetical protein